MDDNELLKQAACAVGFDVVIRALETTGAKVWNPLSDDGQALWLAVNLRMVVDIDEMKIGFRSRGPRGAAGGVLQIHVEGGVAAAVRRTIVRAAAVIGAEVN